jgi:hypothetical protein
MVGKRLCALVSVSVLVALGLVAVVLGELPNPVEEKKPEPFVQEQPLAPRQPARTAAQEEEIRLQEEPSRGLPPPELPIGESTAPPAIEIDDYDQYSSNSLN